MDECKDGACDLKIFINQAEHEQEPEAGKITQNHGQRNGAVVLPI